MHLKPKRLPAVLTVLLMFVMAMNISAADSESEASSSEAPVYTSGDYTYTLVGGRAILKSYIGSTDVAEITVPSEIDGYTVGAIDGQIYYVADGNDVSVSKLEAEKIVIPKGIQNIGVYAFFGCKNLKEIAVADDNEYYCDVDGVLFTKEKNMLIHHPAALSDTEYSVPDSVTNIDYGSFYMNTQLEKINIPDSVTAIGDWAFGYCSSLKSIDIPESNTEIYAYCFAFCTGLTDIKWPESLDKIYGGAFGECSSLTEIVFPDKLTEIAEGAFSDCTGITKVTLPETSLKTISYGAFANCTSLTSIEIPESVTTINNGAVGFNFDSTGEMVASSTFIIKGKTGSEAETFATEYSLKFVSTGTATVTDSSSVSDESDSATDGTSVSSVSSSSDNSENALEKNRYIIFIALLIAAAGVITVVIIKTRKKE